MLLSSSCKAAGEVSHLGRDTLYTVLETHLNPGIIFEEEQNHALVDGVDVIVHRVVESGREDSGEESPRAPGEQVDRRSAQHDRGRNAVA